MFAELSQFHFIRPLWLLAIPLSILLWLLLKTRYQNTHWEDHINQRMLQAMRVGDSAQSKSWRWFLLASWIIASLATAGPSWQKNPVPTLQNQNAMVIVLDLSVSMLAQDLSPDRLTQAKYKLIDILREVEDGQTGLIAYAGDAHTVTPLTDDPNAIEILLPALHPGTMPTKGSNTESAIRLASQLLNDSGVSSGQILLITDGVAQSAHSTILAELDRNHSLSILGVGGTEPAPIPVEGGGFLRDANGDIVLTSPNNLELSRLAQNAGGRFSIMRLDGSDIDNLILNQFESNEELNSSVSSLTSYDSWADMGHWLVLLLLPIAALCFRKGVLYLLPIFMFIPIDSNALEWKNLWKTPDQQGQQLLEVDPQGAAETFENSEWAGVANYRAKNYQAAAQKFATSDDATNHYNRGNALALNGDLDGAIEAYDQALQQSPDFEDAQYNKEIVEQLKQQQEQQQQEQEQEQEQQDSEQGSEQENQDSSEQDSELEQEQSEDSSESEQSDDSQQQQSKDSNESQQEPSADQEPSTEQEQSEEKQEEQAEAESDENEQENATEEQQSVEYIAEETPEQLDDASERFLRNINDDPTGLLRRKFQYEAWLRSRGQTSTTNSNSDEPRY